MIFEKGMALFAKISGIVLILLVGGVVGAYWWANTPPNRPGGVPLKAAWLWAPSVGLPAPKRGMWVSCWQDENSHCRTTDKDGRLYYEGVFLPYKGQTRLPAGDLAIDVARTQEHAYEHALFINEELVPLVYLTGGEVLIAAAKYDKGKQLIDSLQSSR